MNRLENLLKTHARKSAEEIAQAVVVAVNEFVGDAQQFDDVTLVICKREK